MFNLLKNITIIDLSSVVLGPFASQLLADLGADVIKVESPEGDIFRSAGPSKHPKMGAGYLNLNRNKRSLMLNLKVPQGREVLFELVKSADVFMHNMRPDAVKRLGIGYDLLSEINPRLVYCAAVGFGGDGPYANEPAYDDIMQAMSGFASLAQGDSAAPRFAPTVLADKIGGLYTVFGILSGLVQRERTGHGVSIEAPMFESLVSFLLAEHLGGHVFQPALGAMGYSRLTTPYRRPYQTADGYIAVMPYSTKHWVNFLTLIGQEELAQVHWVSDAALRSERIAELYQIIADKMPQKTSSQWLSVLKGLDIPCGPVNTLESLLEDPHLKAIDFFQQVNHPTEGTLLSMKHPVRFIDAETVPDLPAPNLGENSTKILLKAGFDQAAIEKLVASGALKLTD